MCIKRINPIKIIIFVYTLSFLFLGNLITVNYLGLNDKFTVKWPLINFFSLFLILFVFKFQIKISKGKLLFLILWHLLIASIFLSKLIFQNFHLLEYVFYSIFIPFSFYSMKVKEFKILFLEASIISSLPLIFLLNTTNSMGVIFCLAGINLLNLIEIRKYQDKYLYFSIISITLLIYITQSRTSLLAFLLIALVYIINRFKNEKKTFRSFVNKSIKFFFLVFGFVYTYEYFSSLIFNKYSNSEFDLLSSRGEIWRNLFNNGLSLWGNGEEYFTLISGFGDAHNTFLQTLGIYGIVSFIILVILYILILWKSLKIYRIKGDITYIGFFSMFLLLSLTENLFFFDSRMILSNILFFLYLGFLMNENAVEIPKQKGEIHEQ